MNQSPTESVELANCPFCNCAMRISSNRDWHRLQGDHDDSCIFIEEDTLVVPATAEQRATMVADWNRRAAPSPAAQFGTSQIASPAYQAEQQQKNRAATARLGAIAQSPVVAPSDMHPKQESAYKSLVAALRGQLTEVQKEAAKNAEAVNTLASERAANAQLTAELEAARAAPPSTPASMSTDADKLRRLREGLDKWGWCAEFGALAAAVLKEPDEVVGVLHQPSVVEVRGELVGWQWRKVGESWSLKNAQEDRVHALADEFEVRSLWAAPSRHVGPAAKIGDGCGICGDTGTAFGKICNCKERK
jgi:hypothetical protein